MKRMYPDRPVVGVGAVMLWEGRVLLEKRKNEPSKGKWTIPGGLVELGEKLQDAVIREAQEETCLEVKNPSLLDVVDNVEIDQTGKIKYHFIIVNYALEIKSNRCRVASDAEELQWVPLDEVEAYELTQSFRVFFQINRRRLEKLSCCP